MGIESVRELVAELTTSSSALSILGAELQARASGRALDPGLRSHADAILREIGALSALEGTSPDELRPLIAEIRHFSLIDSNFLATPDRAPGWTHDGSDVLTSGGEATQGFPNVLARMAPLLEGLVARLEGADGRFLDVGTGVGLLSIAMARRFASPGSTSGLRRSRWRGATSKRPGCRTASNSGNSPGRSSPMRKRSTWPGFLLRSCRRR